MIGGASAAPDAPDDEDCMAFLRFSNPCLAITWLIMAIIYGLFPLWGTASTLKIPGVRATLHVKDQPVRDTPTSLLIHLSGCLPMIVLGVFQFVPAIRKSCITLHRWSGRGYVICHLVSGFGLLWMMQQFHSKGEGAIFWPMFAMFVATHISLGLAVYNVLIGKIQKHRRWMLRNYAWNTSVVLVRGLALPIMGSFASPTNLKGWDCEVFTDNRDPAITPAMLEGPGLVFNHCRNNSGIVSAIPARTGG